MKISFFLVLILLSVITIAQTKKQEKRYILKLNLSSLLDVTTFPALELSLEKKLNRRISIAGCIGYQLYNLPSGTGYFTTQPDTTFISPKGYKASFEIRYYLRNKSNKLINPSPYFGVNLIYQKNRNNIGIHYSIDSSSSSYDSFWLSKRNIGFCLTAGLQQKINKMVIEIYLGTGGMDRSVNNYNREYNSQKDALTNQRHNIFRIGYSNFNENNGWHFIMQTGLRIGIFF
jgi:hypothetical protein